MAAVARTQAIKELKLAKRTFNVISGALVDQLLGLFKDNGTLKFIRDELDRFSKDLKNSHVPAVRYFKTMNLATKVRPKVSRNPADVTDEEGAIVVGELVIRKDPVIFTDGVGVVIPELEALGMRSPPPPPLTKTQA